MANKRIAKSANTATAKEPENKSKEIAEAIPEVKSDVEEKAVATAVPAAAEAPVAKRPYKKRQPKFVEKDTETFFIEYGSVKLSAEDIINRCKADYKADNSRKQVRTLKVYVKPEDNKAYYVVNGKPDGRSVDL